MRKLLALLAVCALPLAGPVRADFVETELSDPEPDFMEPRRILLQISTDDRQAVENILWNAINLQKFYGVDQVEIAVVVFGPGMAAVYEDSFVADRVKSQLTYGISFVGCGNTMEASDRSPDELIEGVDYVQAGIAEIVERQLRGWVYVRP